MEANVEAAIEELNKLSSIMHRSMRTTIYPSDLVNIFKALQTPVAGKDCDAVETYSYNVGFAEGKRLAIADKENSFTSGFEEGKKFGYGKAIAEMKELFQKGLKQWRSLMDWNSPTPSSRQPNVHSLPKFDDFMVDFMFGQDK